MQSQLSADAPSALAGGHAARGTALELGSELLPRLRQRTLHVGVLGCPTVILLMPRPAECAVEHLLDGTQGDSIILGTDQEVEPGEHCIESKSLKLYLSRFRNEGHFCETLAVNIRDDVAEALGLEEESVRARLTQKARGGITITATSGGPASEPA